MAVEGSGNQIRLIGGPLDGSIVDAESGVEEITVSMADRTRHLYRRESPPADLNDLPAFLYVERLGHT